MDSTGGLNPAYILPVRNFKLLIFKEFIMNKMTIAIHESIDTLIDDELDFINAHEGFNLSVNIPNDDYDPLSLITGIAIHEF